MARKILIVEDDDSWNNLLYAIFYPPEYVIETTQDVRYAQELISSSQFDGTIINIHTDPKMSTTPTGLVMLYFIQQKYPWIPRIVLTGSSEYDLNKYDFDVRFDKKTGFDPNEIREAMEQAIIKRQKLPVEKIPKEKLSIVYANQDSANNIHKFDVFLAHNSQDKPTIEVIAEQLKKHGIKYWIDTEQILPGRWFQDVIQKAIPNVKSVAMFLGIHDLGKWQLLELRAFMKQCVDKDLPLIPVLLPGVEKVPEDLLFLEQLNWVSFESLDDEAALDNLVWGITGKHPKKS